MRRREGGRGREEPEGMDGPGGKELEKGREGAWAGEKE